MGRKIGEVDVVELTKQKQVVQIIMIKKFLLKKPIKIIFTQKDFLGVREGKIILNTTKSEFDKMIKKILAEREYKAKTAKLTEASNLTKCIAISFRGKI